MTTAVTSLARTLCDPGVVCRTVSASITGTRYLVAESVNATVQKTKDAVSRTRALAIGTVHLATRPFVWPLHLSFDLSRRVTLQVLITLGEVLVNLNDLVLTLENQLANPEEQEVRIVKYRKISKESHEMAALTYGTEEEQEEQEQEEGDDEDSVKPMPASRGHALEVWKGHLGANRKLKQANAELRRRVHVTETKYELMNSQIIALKELYRDKLTDMEYDLDILKKERQRVVNMIHSAQGLANDCHGDVQALMDDLHELTSMHGDRRSSTDSLSLDLGLEGLTLTSQQKEWQQCDDSDTGYMDDTDSEYNSHRISRVFHHAQDDVPYSTSSVMSLEATS